MRQHEGMSRLDLLLEQVLVPCGAGDVPSAEKISFPEVLARDAAPRGCCIASNAAQRAGFSSRLTEALETALLKFNCFFLGAEYSWSSYLKTDLNYMSKLIKENSGEINNIYLSRHKQVHIVKAARSATLANILAPLLCIPMFKSEVDALNFEIWLGYMVLAISIRTLIIFKTEFRPEKIQDPGRDMKRVTLAVGIAGFGWGLGWPLMTPDLSLVNRMIYVYMTTAAMIASMFAYSVDRRTFFTFTLPIMIPAVSTILWPVNIFPWPFAVGLIALYLIVLGIANSFSAVFTESVNLRFGNEQLYRELADERDQSIAANMAKSKFIAAASHDLRQPLHAVNINLELFKLPDLKESDANLVRRIKNSVAALNNMFEALLNMSKLDSHATHVDNADFSLNELSSGIKEMVELSAMAKGLDLDIDSMPAVIRGDRLLLQQLLINLVMNAIQYTERGKVEVRFLNESGRLAVEVIDSGVGIPAEDQENIFNEFYRVEHTRNDHEGLGLGLSIVKRLCTLIGASVSVKSNLDKGSVFKVVTNCAMNDGLSVPSAADNILNAECERVDDLHDKVIAVIEDNGVIADAYRQTLLAHGAKIIVLSENDEDLQLQLESIDEIDCILSDYHLQKSTGVELVEKIRESYNRDIPAVVVTGETSPGNINSFSELNAIVLYKPLTLSKIMESIHRAIHKS